MLNAYRLLIIQLKEKFTTGSGRTYVKKIKKNLDLRYLKTGMYLVIERGR